MIARKSTTKEATDAIYAVEQPYALDYDWPIAPYPAPASVAAIVRKPRKRADRVVDMNGVVHKATDDTLETVIKTALVIPHSALEPMPTEVRPMLPPLPIDEPDVQSNTTSEPLPAPMYATGIQKDARGWYLPVFGSPRMWELLHPKLKEREGFVDAVQVGKSWRIYLEPVMGSMSTAAMQLRGFVYGFDPFKNVIVVDNDRDESTTRLVRDYYGKTVRE